MPLPLVSQVDVWADNPAAMEISNSTRASFMNPPIGMAYSRTMFLTLGTGAGVTWKIGRAKNRGAEADERGSEQHHGGGLGNVRGCVRLVGIDSAVRADAVRDGGVLDDGDTVALPGVNGVQKGKLERQARVVRGSEVGGSEVGCGHHVKRRGVHETA